MSGLRDAWTAAPRSSGKFRAAASPKPGKRKRKPPPPFSIRFTEEERARLDQDAGTLSLAAYIRLKLFDGIDPPPTKRKPTRRRYAPSAELAVVAQMLAGLGESQLALNLRQIARAAIAGSLPVIPELEQELHETCAAVQAMRRDLIEALGIKDQEN